MRRVVVLGAGLALRERPDADEVIVLDPWPAELERAAAGADDPRWSFLLGELPVLPLPDAWVDRVLGAGGATDGGPEDAAELARVRR